MNVCDEISISPQPKNAHKLMAPPPNHLIYTGEIKKYNVLKTTFLLFVLQSYTLQLSSLGIRHSEFNIASGSRDGAVVRALASHQCGLGSIPGLGVMYGLSLLLVLILAPRGFSPGTPAFLSP